MKENIIFFDLDGTLCPDGHLGLPEATANIFPQIINNHSLPVITTGRSFYEIESLLAKLKVHNYILSNGCYVVFADQIIQNYQMPEAIMVRLIDDAKKNNYDLGFFNQHGFAVTGINEATKHHMARMGIENVKVDESFYLSNRVNFMNAYIDESTEVSYRNKFSEDVSIVRYAPMAVDILPKDISKAQAIKKLLSTANIEVDKTYAFGDQNNDLTMFEYVDFGIAMKDATDDLKQRATFIAQTDSGVIEGLKHYQLV